MKSRCVRRALLQVEALESRLAPATRVSPTVLTYHDVDGDPVRVTFSKPILTSDTVANTIFKFNNGIVDNDNAAQQQLWRIDLSSAAGAKGTSITTELDGPPASGGDGKVHVGFINGTGRDLGKVSVAGDLGRLLAGDNVLATPALAALQVDSMGVKGLTTQATGGTLDTNLNGSVGRIVAAGSIQHAEIRADSLGLLRIGDSLIGGDDGNSGSVIVDRSISEVRIGGSISGGTANASGYLSASIGFGNINIGGSVTGGSGLGSGRVHTFGNVGKLAIGGSIVGGTEFAAGSINADGKLTSVTVAGDVVGGTGDASGLIEGGSIGSVSIAGDVDGTSAGGSDSGSIFAGKIKRVSIDGSLRGGGGFQSGRVFTASGLGSLTIDGLLVGGTGFHAGWVESEGSIGDISIGLIWGGSIAAAGNLGHVSASSGILGFANARSLIAAGGALGRPARIARLSLGGTVEFADILAGYDAAGQGPISRSNADARIGRVSVEVHWIASNLVAGVDSGADGRFGTADDGATVAGSADFVSKLGPITIGGILDGTATTGDSFGIVAELIKSLSINGNSQTLTPGALNDADGITTNSGTGDFRLIERQA